MDGPDGGAAQDVDPRRRSELLRHAREDVVDDPDLVRSSGCATGQDEGRLEADRSPLRAARLRESPGALCQEASSLRLACALRRDHLRGPRAERVRLAEPEDLSAARQRGCAAKLHDRGPKASYFFDAFALSTARRSGLTPVRPREPDGLASRGVGRVDGLESTTLLERPRGLGVGPLVLLGFVVL